MPVPGDGVRTAGDIGMYADVDLKLMFGISFGTDDPEAKVNDLHMHRLPVEQGVVLHDTPA